MLIPFDVIWILIVYEAGWLALGWSTFRSLFQRGNTPSEVARMIGCAFAMVFPIIVKIGQFIFGAPPKPLLTIATFMLIIGLILSVWGIRKNWRERHYVELSVSIVACLSLVVIGISRLEMPNFLDFIRP